MTAKSLIFTLLVLQLVPACDPRDDVFGTGHILERGGSGSSIKFNTNVFDSIDELDAKGQVWGGVRLGSVQLPCPVDSADLGLFPADCGTLPFFTLDEVWSDAGQLRGSVGGLTYQAGDFLNSEWTVEVYHDGLPVEEQHLFIRDYYYSEALHHYTFNRRLSPDTWLPTCEGSVPWPIEPGEEPAGGPALVLGNVSVNTTTGVISERPDTLYIACLGGAVNKAIQWGYRPWELGAESFTGAVRVVRADYCGDGTSWTKKGTRIDLLDVWGYNNSDFSKSVSDEAIWNAQGAVCLSKRRVDLSSPYVKLAAVYCKGVMLPKCDDEHPDLYPNALFWTKNPPLKPLILFE